jgi:hemoglobin
MYHVLSADLITVMNADIHLTFKKSVDGRITFWDKASENLFGFCSEEILGRQISLIIPFDWLDEEYRMVDRLRSGEKIETYQTVRRSKAGLLYNVNMTQTALLDEAGKIKEIEVRLDRPSPYRAHLYEALGGKEGIARAVQILYARILDDPLLAPFFPRDKMDKLKSSQTAFLTMAFGGPHEYTGKKLRDVHAPLVDKGMTDKHFDAVVFHLEKTMEIAGILPDIRNEILAFGETTRADILCR